MDYLLVGLGSALGGMARYWIALATLNRYGPGFPWGTLIVNVTGSFAIGLVATLAVQDRWPISHPSYQRFLLIGLFGGFTTFSSFSLQTLNLLEKGQSLFAGLNIVGSIATCLLAVWLGARAGKALIG